MEIWFSRPRKKETVVFHSLRSIELKDVATKRRSQIQHCVDGCWFIENDENFTTLELKAELALLNTELPQNSRQRRDQGYEEHPRNNIDKSSLADAVIDVGSS
jgi:hypothetical protein